MAINLQLLVSLLSVVISVAALYRTRISTERQRRIQLATYVQSYLKNLHEWCESVIDSLTQAVFLVELDPRRMEDGAFFEKRRCLRENLSALLDKGRLYLPNTEHEFVGDWKEGAYKGLRQEALNYVACAYTIVETLDFNEQAPNLTKRNDLVKVKRKFVSEVQEALDVRRTSALISKLAREVNS